MRELPILFSAPMVRAILEGRKTVTRRVVKGTALEWLAEEMFSPAYVADPGNGLCPYGQAGDRLWVRETWGLYDQGFDGAGESDFPVYKADTDRPEPPRWRPSIHMPKELARIWLEVTAVRVERLQDITYEQAIAEGAIDAAPSVDHFQPGGEETGEETARRLRWPQRDFEMLWDSLAKPGTHWADNPWVWVVEFRRVEVPSAR